MESLEEVVEGTRAVEGGVNSCSRNGRELGGCNLSPSLGSVVFGFW